MSKNYSNYLRKCLYDVPLIDCRITNVVRQERGLYNKEVQTRDMGKENGAGAAQVEAGLRKEYYQNSSPKRGARPPAGGGWTERVRGWKIESKPISEVVLVVSLRTIALMTLPEPRFCGRMRDRPHRPGNL